MPGAVSIAALTVLFHNAPDAIVRTVRSFDNAVRVGIEDGVCSHFVLAFGDASPEPLLTDDEIEHLQSIAPHLDVVYEYFAENTGTSKGQNRLSRLTQSDFVLLCNPDVVPDARAPWRMAAVFDDPQVGLVEAKQLPVEHPKDYDPETGFTSWGSGAFSMVRRSIFEEVGGFDEDTFFLYCDDVDLSWRIREAGYDVCIQPAAVVFHDKELSGSGGWVPTEAERYYSAEAALLLAHKWSRDDIVHGILAAFAVSEEAHHHRAADEFERRRDAGELVVRRDPNHSVGRFIDGNYARHRYAL